MLEKTPMLLNPDFRYILDALEKGSDSMFVTGRAGTGKSTLLQLFRNTTRKKTAVLAPTGVAALNVLGQTIHSFFGFPPRIITAQEAAKRVARKDKLRLYRNLEVLIIDEISMVRADVLDAINLFLQVNRESLRPFGGVQLVLFGDPFQLPPVVTNDPVESAYFNDYYRTPYFFSAKVFQEPGFQIEMIELSKVYRQESRHFLRLLEAVRVNELDYDDLEDLNERWIPDFRQTDGFITLCARNATADRINWTALEQLAQPEQVYQAEIKGQFDPALYPTEAALKLRVGAQVMFVKNDPEKNFVNGTIGRVIELKANQLTVAVENSTGKSRALVVTPMDWEIIRYTSGAAGDIETESIGSFRQFPLKLAWAITIHKSQGKTFDRVLIDLGAGAFEHGQLYVALSRCRTLEGVVLRNPVRPQDIITDERVVDFFTQNFQ
ncbi:MAG: AAA family ATPase [Lewinellaceae bacterium]|nr:AAA family ATPase [Lewinellaceae bacterium]